MTTSDKSYVIPFKSRGRLFVEVPEHVERDGQIVAGAPLKIELVGEDIVYHKAADAARPQKLQEELGSNLAGKGKHCRSSILSRK